jgi:hypothetical protein
MTMLTKIEDTLSGEQLYAWEANPKVSSYDASWQRRSGTYTVLGMDYGVNPFGSYAAPIQTKKLVWKFRVVVPLDANRLTNLDLAAASVHRACAKKRQHLLCRSFAGKEQVTKAWVSDLQDVTTSVDLFRHRDFTITWELNNPWGERTSRNPGLHRVGENPSILVGSPAALAMVMGGTTTAVTANPMPFAIYADGSDGFGSPTLDSTSFYFRIYGPFGGDGGFILLNVTPGALLQDDGGNLVNTFFTYTKKLLAGQSLSVDTGALTATNEGGNDVTANLLVPDYQPWWQVVVAGKVNNFTVAGLGANQTFNSAMTRFFVSWDALYS